VTVAPDDPLALSKAISDVLAGRSAIDRAGAIRYARQFTTARVADFYLAEYQAMLTPRLGPSRLGSDTPPDQATGCRGLSLVLAGLLAGRADNPASRTPACSTASVTTTATVTASSTMTATAGLLPPAEPAQTVLDAAAVRQRIGQGGYTGVSCPGR
jgi:hypothetical protein